MKIFSDKKYLRGMKDIRPILMPFWGHEENSVGPTSGRFDCWVNNGKDVFEMVSLDEADIAVYPMDPTIDRDSFRRFQQVTGNKKVIAFFNSDSDEVLSYRDNVYIFRTSFYKSKQRDSEFALPGWSEDWGACEPNPWKEKPIVGFCGQVHRPKVRFNALTVLEKDTNVKTNFIKKNDFWGGWLNRGRKLQDGQSLRNEFVKNIGDSDYILCARGGGNFSYRIYETLMTGRIPILIDTDCVLPYDFIVYWGEEFPIIRDSDINSLGKRVIDFHNSVKNDFEEHQSRMRKLWEEWISPCGFFTNLYRHLGE